MDHSAIAADLLAAYRLDRVLPRVTETHPGFSVEDGYAVAHLMRDLRLARGEVPVGRKIGGTNRATYHLTGATGPMWNFMYSTTVRELPDGIGHVTIGPFRQSRIEPELVLHLGAPPKPGMDEAELIKCVDRVAHGLEFVFSPYSDWKVAPPDANAAYGLHQAAIIGPWIDIEGDREGWVDRLKAIEVTLTGSNGEVRRGIGANALGSPLLALKAIVDDIGLHADWTPLSTGEIVTTGTLTELMPAVADESWTTTIAGAPLHGLSVRLD